MPRVLGLDLGSYSLKGVLLESTGRGTSVLRWAETRRAEDAPLDEALAVFLADKATEAIFKGTVEEVKDHQCPVSRGLGSHLMLKQLDGTVIEIHLALTKFVTQYELVFQKGDALEVTGVKVKFEGVDTIFARKIKRGNDEFLFHDNDGKPLW